jgi:hypothetical protein
MKILFVLEHYPPYIRDAKNVDNAVVLARLFNEASGQKAPSKKHGLFISRPYEL